MKHTLNVALAAVAITVAFFVFVDHAKEVQWRQTAAAELARAASSPSGPPASPQTAWQLDSKANPATGEVTTTASLKYRDERNIIVRQRGRRLQCYITTGDFLETVDNLDSRQTPVVYRFDGGKPVRQTWTISDDNEAIFYPGDPSSFLDKIRRSKTLSVQYEPADVVPQSVTFEVGGFPDAFSAAHPVERKAAKKEIKGAPTKKAPVIDCSDSSVEIDYDADGNKIGSHASCSHK